MAKHSKGNNIISYDEAKQKKLREKQKQENDNAARHLKIGKDDYEDFFEDGYVGDAANYSNLDINEQSRHAVSRDRDYYSRRDAKYAEKKEPLPKNLVNLIIVVVMTLFLAVISGMIYNYYVVETINVTGNHDINYYNITELCGVDYKQSMMTV